MSWFDKLLAALGTKFGDISFFNNWTINIGNTAHMTSEDKDRFEGKAYVIDEGAKVINIDVDQLDGDTKALLGEATRKHIKEGDKLFKGSTAEVFKKVKLYTKTHPYSKVIRFFQDEIPPEDLEALKASMYLRDEFYKHHDVTKFKSDIVDQFGQRGKNICNLCTAGYFEGFFIPIWNDYHDEFDRLYEIIVSQAIIAVFVHYGMKEDDFLEEVKYKVDMCKRYGLGALHIHGIGTKNCRNVKKWIEDNKEDIEFVERSLYDKEKVLVVELIFK